MQSLQQRFPVNLVSYDTFTYPRFLFSFNTIQVLIVNYSLIFLGEGIRPPIALDCFGPVCWLFKPLERPNEIRLQCWRESHFSLVPNWPKFVWFSSCSNLITLPDTQKGPKYSIHTGGGPMIICCWTTDSLFQKMNGRRFSFISSLCELNEVAFHWKIPTTDNLGYQRLKISRAHGFAPLQRIVLHQRELPLVVSQIFPLTWIGAELLVLSDRFTIRVRDRNSGCEWQ